MTKQPDIERPAAADAKPPQETWRILFLDNADNIITGLLHIKTACCRNLANKYFRRISLSTGGDIMLQLNKQLIPAIFLVFLVGCASQQKSDTAQTSSTAKPALAVTASTPGGRIVKSKDGTIEGEIVGTPAAKSKFAKLQIGMTPEEVEKLIGKPDETDSHMTGKTFIPFYFGGDTRRLETLYKREGQLTFANTNNFIAPNALIKIVVNPKATGISK